MTLTIDEFTIIAICLYSLGAVSMVLIKTLWNRWHDDPK